MALIIRLNNEFLPAQDEPANEEFRAEETAEVILFPGVRYERWSDAQPETGVRRSGDAQGSHGEQNTEPSMTKRDWLEV